MSDSPTSTPPKPKPGSLRDRIAAFENKATANAAPERPPPPRPKPAGFAGWKPKPPSPPESPAASGGSVEAAGGEGAMRGAGAGMSAVDAKESIRAGGSLKERMAALQGRGGFGAPAPPVTSPKPAVERPKWKPPLQVASPPPVDEDDAEKDKAQEEASEEADAGSIKSNTPSIKSPPPIVKSPPPIIRSPPSVLEDEAPRVSGEGEGSQENVENAEAEPVPVDEEEEERQRRAALAARMAKLGGARIGMGPPIFGRPAVPPPTKKPSLPTSVPAPEAEPQVAEEIPAEQTETTTDTSPRPPAAMPMATIPKRTAPPRRKPAKQTSAGSAVSSEASPPVDTPGATSLSEESAGPSVPADDVIAEVEEKIVAEPDTVEAEPEPEAASLVEEKYEDEEKPETVEETEEDEEARKSRVAEKLAKMGGINPFALPPVRRPSVGSTASAEGVVSPPTSPPIPTRKSTLPGSPRPVPVDKPAGLRRASGGSVKSFESPSSGVDVTRRASIGSVTSVRSATSEVGAGVGRRASVGSVRSVTKPEVLPEVQGIVEEQESAVPEDSDSAPASRTRTEVEESATAKDHDDEVVSERDVYDSHEDEAQDKDTQSDEHSNDYEDDIDFEATPQPPPHIPSSVQQEGSRGRDMYQVNPDIVASVLPPPPPRSPPTLPSSTSPTATTRTTTEAPLPPRIVPASRDHSVDRDRLSGPAPPRRIVPQTPEPQTPEQLSGDLDDNDDASASEGGNIVDEEEAGSELARSTRFVPPPAATVLARRTLLGADIDDGEESEPPLRVPPPPGSAGLAGAPSGGRGRGAYDDTDDESNASGAALPVRVNIASSEGTGEAARRGRPLPPPPPPPMVSRPAPIVLAEQEGSVSEYGDDASHGRGHVQGHEHEEEEERVLHTRPLSEDRSYSLSSSAADIVENIPLVVPPRLSEGGGVRHAPARSVPPPPPSGSLPPPPPLASSRPGSQLPEKQLEEEEAEDEKEILDEDEGDPIDPAFHSPSRRASFATGGELEHAQTQAILQAQTQGQGGVGSGGSQTSLSPSSAAMRSPPPPPPPALSSPPPPAAASTIETKEEGEEDEEKVKRQTIAERMARLGGIKFGASPARPPIPVPPPPRKTSTSAGEAAAPGEVQADEPSGEKEELPQEHVQGGGGGDDDGGEDEEEERARRERIAAKLAGMGGMRIGMMPMAMPPRQSHVLREEPTHPQELPPPPPPPRAELPTARGSGASESGTSEDGVKVEAEESEIEEVGYEEAKGLEEGSGEEVPPLPPARPPNRRGTGASASSAATAISPPTSPTARPPVPVPGPFRRTSIQSTGSSSTTRKSLQQPAQAQHSEYVLVDEPRVIGEDEEEEVPPPPPMRPPHRAPPPARVAPSAPPAAPSMGDSISSQWELPAIPTSSLGGDLSASWSEALVDDHGEAPSPTASQQAAPVPVPPPAAAPTTRSPEALHLNADDLMAVWGRVGVQICEVATTMHDHSKKNLVGDGTYRGFVDAVLREVPNAAKPQTKQIPYGYLVYLQSGGQVQKRASEIMPGDVVEIADARFKGHKGLGGYQQHVGGEGGGPVVGVVCEFEPKKSKVRVFQANQHVGQQTVESASYRLDDLKSGLVKVYRVLEA
ncbi:hypothetical protein D9756_005132 [Leucocoprinus leucothites]|uniref:BBC1/AIM3 cysteine proteinase-fold domain-containing protein n=1 Tax=Leucocoprinus leucothites TaxID=201217 RepID=A0A8H5LKP2_9AGAR|nr:hypothetical protein D9756_005132 [Leucoagaricus leucothites]